MSLTRVQGAMWLTQTWTTATRPSSPYNGQIGYNSTLNQLEVYQNGAWTQYATTYSVDYLVVAGGGGGAGANGGAGGAGGYLSNVALIPSAGIVYTITVGAGGTAGAASVTTRAGNGANSSLIGTSVSVTAIGGGGGASFNNGASFAGAAGGSEEA
jgi:hypothetical protein